MIEMICGAYGAKGRLIRPSDGPFTLSAEEERRLVERGVARYVREYMEPMLPETLNFKMEYEGNPKGEAGPTTLTPPLSGPEESGGDPLTPEGSAESEPFSREELDDMTKDNLLTPPAIRPKELGAATKFTANESGEAMGYMGMAGWNAQQMLAGMPGVLDLAAASGEDLAGVADIVTDSLTGFGLTAADTSGFVDVLAAASSKSNTNVVMLGESFKYAAPLCGTLGYEAEDTAVMLGLMANSGIKASQAGTTLRTALANLVSPTKEQAAEMERLGLSLTDSSGQMLPLLTLAESLRDRFSDMSQAEQSAAARALFGKEAMSGMLAIINASEADFNSLTDSIYNSAGAAQRMADIKLDNLAGDLTLLQSAADGLSLSIGEQFMPQARGLVQAGTGVITFVNQLIDVHPVLTKVILGTAGAVGVLTTGLVAFNAAKKAAAAVNLAAMFAGPVGPALALVGGVAAVTAGLVGWFEAANEGRPKVEELTEAARGLDQAMQDAAGGYEASQTELAATAGLADHYLDRLEALDSVTHKTQEQQEQYHAKPPTFPNTRPTYKRRMTWAWTTPFWPSCQTAAPRAPHTCKPLWTEARRQSTRSTMSLKR